MDLWKYFAIGHERHVLCNPFSESKIDELIELLALPEGGRVLDIACGKGEFLVRVARRWRCHAVGVDLSPYAVADARARVAEAGLEPAPEVVEANGRDYQAPAGSIDAAVCLGASWIFGGYEGTLRALADWIRPGGIVVAGEPFWRCDPSPAHLEAAGLERSSFGTHADNVRTGVGLGLVPLHAMAASVDDWDRYEGYQWLAAERYAARVPGDPDVPELLDRMHQARDNYLRWGRDELGWAVYLFSKPAAA